MISIKRTAVLLCIFSVCILFMNACHSDWIYHQKITLPSSQWPYSNRMEFKWNIEDTLPTYDMELVVEHSPQLAYRNVYIKTYTRFPDASEKDQLLSLELFDEAGKAYGPCNSDACETPILLQSRLRFPQTGTYLLKIEQYGRDSILNGIQSFELRLKRNAN